MTIIDTHVHFWKYDAIQYSWINEQMQPLQRDCLPGAIAPVLESNQIAGCVAVEAHLSEQETMRLLDYASKHAFIRGVVGYVDLTDELIEDRLKVLNQYRQLKGFRTWLQAEQPAYMLQPSFLHGIGLLQQYNFTFDLLLLPQHLDCALELVSRFPWQRFVVDHLAKPAIRSQEMAGWKQGIEALAQHGNVYCKISGMVTEADWHSWNGQSLTPYLDIVTNSFGVDRIMFGSDWPVCTLASSYSRWLQTVSEYYSTYSTNDQEMIFGKNAQVFYNLLDVPAISTGGK